MKTRPDARGLAMLILFGHLSLGAAVASDYEANGAPLRTDDNIVAAGIAYEDFPGWARKQAITINSGNVAGTVDLTDFPFLVTLDHLDEEIVNGGANSALNGGGDIRFSSDIDGNNRLAVEVVEFVTSTNPSNRRCQIWVKIPSLSPNTDTTIYMWYGNPGEAQPVPSDTYGSQTVWTNYDFVSHDIRTESSSGRAITKNTEAGLATGPFGTNVSDFDGVDDFHSFDNSGMGLGTSRTISCWVSFDDTNNEWQRIFQSSGLSGDGDPHGIQIIKRYDYLYFGADNNSGGIIDITETIQTGSYPANSWVRVTGDWATLGTKGTMKVNNGQETGASDTQLYSLNGRTARFAGRNTNDNWFDGRISTFTISRQKLSDAYVTTEYNNQSGPASFASAGTPTDAGSGSGGSGGSGTTGGHWAKTGDDLHYQSGAGNVGIGRTAITGYKLAVEGKVRSREVRVDNDTWADYVFEGSYDLPTLEEVEAHIRRKGHLMNIPSAQEVRENGLELGQMDRLLLEKIEELTLHIIRMDKEIQRLRAQKGNVQDGPEGR